jgi:hypothetical protein
MFTVLAACETLQALNLKIDSDISLFYPNITPEHSKFPGLAESKVAVRGLKKLTLEILTPPAWYYSNNMAVAKSLCKSLESLLVEEMAKPRGKFLLLSVTCHAIPKQSVCCMPLTFRDISFNLPRSFVTRSADG